MSDAHGHGDDTRVGGIIGLVIFCILAVLALAALFLPKDATKLFLSLNEDVLSFFESPFFMAARFISGVLIVGLSGLGTWLFFKLLEMEKEHEEHVYHHAHVEEHHEVVGAGKHVEVKLDHHTKTQPPVSPELAPENIHTEVSSRVKTAPPPSRLPGESGVRGAQVGEEHPGHFQWQSVLRLATSTNPSDWKLAIIEADVILDMMTYMQGFPGGTLGERLKNADPGSFQSLKYAKAAHHLRNQIAHEPNLEITPRDINQTIRMYEAVFDEFKYI